jgi:hypothetical protein
LLLLRPWRRQLLEDVGTSRPVPGQLALPVAALILVDQFAAVEIVGNLRGGESINNTARHRFSSAKYNLTTEFYNFAWQMCEAEDRRVNRVP